MFEGLGYGASKMHSRRAKTLCILQGCPILEQNIGKLQLEISMVTCLLFTKSSPSRGGGAQKIISHKTTSPATSKPASRIMRYKRRGHSDLCA